MAGGTTPPGDATRYLETKQGILSYSQLAPLLAERVLGEELKIENGFYSQWRLDGDLLLAIHRSVASDLVDWAGRWRSIEVQVSDHRPPAPAKVPLLVRDYSEDLEARISGLATSGAEVLLETLAFAEGRLLFIHPFQDFNGRVTRLLLRELLRRLDLPAAPLVAEGAERLKLLEALSAADRCDWAPLVAVWKDRFQKAA